MVSAERLPGYGCCMLLFPTISTGSCCKNPQRCPCERAWIPLDWYPELFGETLLPVFHSCTIYQNCALLDALRAASTDCDHPKEQQLDQRLLLRNQPVAPAAALMNDQHFANHEEFEATQNAIASWLDARQRI